MSFPTEREVLLERIDKFLSPIYWTSSNVHALMCKSRENIQNICVYSVQKESGALTFQDIICKDFQPTQVGKAFGPTWSTHWFRLEIQVPEDYSGREIWLEWDSNSEALLYDAAGAEVQAFTGGGGADRRAHCPLFQEAVGGHSSTWYIEMVGLSMCGNGEGTMISAPSEDKQFTLSTCALVVPNKAGHALFWDMTVINDLARRLPAEAPLARAALRTARKVLNTVDPGAPEASAAAALGATAALLGGRGEGAGGAPPPPPPPPPGVEEVWALGHCHIDCAWLWPLAEARRKVARSWATQLHLMDRYPAFTFTASQVVQYEWIKEDRPALYQKILEKIRAGRFVPVGGTYVEMDCNLPSGESLARQFLYGQRFFQSEFGAKASEFWLPDTFGYAPQLPQLMRQAGISRFLSQKLSWNLTNKFPYTTFYWEGLDGSTVLAHFPPNDNYNSSADVEECLKAVAQQRAPAAPQALLLYGHGDGGGGPAPSHLEQLARLGAGRDTAGPLESAGFPRVRHCRSPAAFFERLEASLSAADDGAGGAAAAEAPRWVGELYLELHQGTFTSQARHKFLNRRCEEALKSMELYMTMAYCIVGAGKLPALRNVQDQLDSNWKAVLLNQFHDILPGSSIQQVHEEANAAFEEVLKFCRAKIFSFRQLISVHFISAGKDPEKGGGESVTVDILDKNMIVWNCLGFDRENEIVELDSEELLLALTKDSNDGSTADFLLQRTESRYYISHSSGEEAALPSQARGGLLLASAPSMGCSFVKPQLLPRGAAAQVQPCSAPPGATAGSDGGDGFQLSNGLVCATLDSGGRLVSFVDYRDRTGAAPSSTGGAEEEEAAGGGGGGGRGGGGGGGRGRELVPPGRPANALALYDDRPFYWDAWDVMPYHLERRHSIVPLGGRVVESGPLRASVLFEYRIGESSSLFQEVQVCAFSPKLVFKTYVSWFEDHKILKAEFPLAVRGPEALYETAYGVARRPAHANTSWDRARHEVCGHRFAALEESGYGVALLNDSKYGHSCRGDVLALTLLRAPRAPDPTCDRGRHRFAYALLPYRGGLAAAGVPQRAQAFNQPLEVSVRPADLEVQGAITNFSVEMHSIERKYSLLGICNLSTSCANVILDLVKLKTDEPLCTINGRLSLCLIVRMYESTGGRGAFQLCSALPIMSAVRCNILEEDIEGTCDVELLAQKPPNRKRPRLINANEKPSWVDVLPLTICPFEVITVKVFVPAA